MFSASVLTWFIRYIYTKMYLKFTVPYENLGLGLWCLTSLSTCTKVGYISNENVDIM